MEYMTTIERWGVYEFRTNGISDGNPFVEQFIQGDFNSPYEKKRVTGFYDGNGVYVIRFMPSFVGRYHYSICGSFSEQTYEGEFQVVSNQGKNHGPVEVVNQYHFSYADNTPFHQIGTTCYAWTHQEKSMQERTIETLRDTPFNKLRFCIFPKHYDYNLYEPVSYPYEGSPCSINGITKENFESYLPSNPENQWDFYRFCPSHFQQIENRIKQLGDSGIEADLILFHPYDRWGFSQMGEEADLLYVRYVVARFSAYRNVWWSLANEYDLCTAKTIKDWERIADTIVKEDPYHHLRSIHNCKNIYDFTKPWITHCSIQRTEIYTSAAKTKEWREQYKKPVILDEVGYEGNINYFWGNLTAEEMVRLFWAATVRGGYCGHGETYLHPDNKLWWSHGGILYGESSSRLQFLLTVLQDVPGGRLKPANLRRWDDNVATAECPDYEGKYYLCYTDRYRPGFREFEFEKNKSYEVEVLDTWNTTIEYRGIYTGKFYIELPSRPYMAIRIRQVKG